MSELEATVLALRSEVEKSKMPADDSPEYDTACQPLEDLVLSPEQEHAKMDDWKKKVETARLYSPTKGSRSDSSECPTITPETQDRVQHSPDLFRDGYCDPTSTSPSQLTLDHSSPSVETVTRASPREMVEPRSTIEVQQVPRLSPRETVIQNHLNADLTRLVAEIFVSKWDHPMSVPKAERDAEIEAQLFGNVLESLREYNPHVNMDTVVRHVLRNPDGSIKNWDLGNLKLNRLPACLFDLKVTGDLDLYSNQLVSLPDTIGNIPFLS